MVDDIQHRSAQNRDRSAMFLGQLQQHINPVDRRSKGGNQQTSGGFGKDAIEVGPHRLF